MKISKILFASIFLLTGTAQAMTDALPSLSQCLQNATTPHGKELCQRLENCQRNHSDTNQELRDCILKANIWHNAAHKDYKITVSTTTTKKIKKGKNGKTVHVVSRVVAPQVNVNIHGENRESSSNVSNGILDSANSNADWVADMTGSRGKLMGPN